MKLFTRLMLLLAGIAVVVPAALAADPNEKAIKARRAVMTLRSWYAGPLFMMAKGDMAYDAAAASTTAAHLKMVVNAEAGAMWPEGSDNTKYSGMTRAKPEGWTEYDAKYGKAMGEAADAMASAAGNGLDALRANIGALGDACSGCHDANRAEDF